MSCATCRGWYSVAAGTTTRAKPAISCSKYLSRLPQETWWSLNSFVAGIHEKQPDFQRPGGDYDSWFIQRAGEKNFLRGFDTWEEVDGALIRFLISGPLHWLGWYDLAAPTAGASPTAFRPSAWAKALWQGQAPAGLAERDCPAAGHLRWAAAPAGLSSPPGPLPDLALL